LPGGDETKIDQIGFLVAKSDFSINFHPNHLFGGRFSVDGKPIDTSVGTSAPEASLARSGRVHLMYRRDEKLAVVELEN